MSKYTTELRFICEQLVGFNQSQGYKNVDYIISQAITRIFDFNFPIFDENYRNPLEIKILKHFYTREICEETVGLWKLRLATKLNEIMPYYNQLYESQLIEFDLFKTVNGTGTTRNTKYDSSTTGSERVKNTNNITEDSNSESNIKGTTSAKSVGESTNNSTVIDLYSDTPQGALTGVTKEKYLTNARKTNTDSTATSNTTDNTTNASDEKYTDHREENSNFNGNKNNSNIIASTEDYVESINSYQINYNPQHLMQFRESFINIDLLILDELETLFFNLW